MSYQHITYHAGDKSFQSHELLLTTKQSNQDKTRKKHNNTPAQSGPWKNIYKKHFKINMWWNIIAHLY